jgi:hypothetical protein
MALTQVNSGLLDSNAQYTGFKNRLINSAMVIDQRNAGASVTPSNGAYTLDRWFAYEAQNASKFSVQQNAGSVTPPAGFTNYLGVTSLSAYSIATNDVYAVGQAIEGFNVADFGWGTANAKTVTLSFWVRSSLTGTFGGVIRSRGDSNSYPFTYTISSATTWEQKSVTITGPTSGTFPTNNSASFEILFGLGVGASLSNTAGAWSSATTIYGATGGTSVVGTNGATFYITGVQLEKGSTATSFDYRPYGTEFMLCQRYYIKYQGDGSGSNGFAIGYQASTTVALFALNFPVTMRSEPTCTLSNVITSDGITYDAATTFSAISSSFTSAQIQVTTSAVGAQFRPFRVLGTNNTASYIDLSSEL